MEPEASLVLLKGTGTIAHEGGRRFERDDLTYRLLRDWIAEGLRPDLDEAARARRPGSHAGRPHPR